MSKLIYITNTSLDGYIEDETGAFNWLDPDRVFSRTLAAATARNTRVERDFDVDAIRKLKRESAHDMIVGGAELDLFINPVIVGGGKRAFRAGLRLSLELLETRRFDNGVIHLHYRIPGSRV